MSSDNPLNTQPRSGRPPALSETSRIVLGACFRIRTFSAYHEIQGAPEQVAKVACFKRRKRYPLGLTIDYPMRFYTGIKYRQRDLIAYEASVIADLARTLGEFLPAGQHLRTTTDGRSALVCDRVRDYDGRPSRFLKDVGGVSDAVFRSETLRLADLLRTQELFLMSVFEAGNVLVKRESESESRPVLWPDVLKCGRALYPLQFHLLLSPILRLKFERRLARFLEEWALGPD